ncbi:NADH-quinone oxidoreductase subunit L [candidate division GN15 bacterium]|uniref:NADH-quinone oxidoreductase subunit L n=1 Tax=candidate division GN15 bacterium TaxID=2072418 RepID=A0A855WX95_9BACT|nr:MAG: NADH-quinone oxidoreductase subunit L [candidate division GN15 bacterium]
MTPYAYIIALLPLFSFLMIVFFLRWKEQVSSLFSISMIVLGWVLSLIVFIETLGRNGAPYESYFYITSFAGINFELGILVDSLTAIMLMVVTTVGACVQIYSVGYMKDDPRYSRFFAYLSLFTFSMLGLVLANNFFMIFIFWELVGLTSYLLISFWFEKKSAADAGKKAFITTRIGDLGFIVGLMMIAFYAGTFNYQGVFAKAAGGQIPAGILTVTAIFVFCGAVGKSAQFPLHVWLPDAMEGPTPVSALIHAATMVAAGVYLVARSMPIFASTADGAMVVATIGLITSFIAASIGLVQNDIKRILAYSTVSQLGYMIMALGLFGHDTALGEESVGYTAGTLHLMTHAFFKGLLFLGAGSVIHAVHTNDIQDMGGLSNKMKITTWTFIIASLSIAGIFPLSGFWSKDEIVATTLHHPVFFIGTLTIAFMTAFYMFRLCFLTFFGKPRDHHRYDHAHESPNVMTYPLVLLAVLSIFAGWWALPWLSHGYSSFVHFGEVKHEGPNYALMLISTIVAVSGITLAYLMYYRRSISAEKAAERFKPIYTFLYNKWYFDELYQKVIIDPIMKIADFMWNFDARVIDGAVNGTAWLTVLWSDIKLWFDVWIVDGAVNGSGWIIRQLGGALRYLQTGSMQFYALFIVVLVVLIAVFKFELVRIDRAWPFLTLVLALGFVALRFYSRLAAERNDGQSGISQEEKS